MHQVAVLALESALATHVAGTYEFLSSVPNMWRQLNGIAPKDPVFDVTVCGLSKGMVTCYNGFCLNADSEIDQITAPDIIIIPGIYNTNLTDLDGELPTDLIDDEARLLAWLINCHKRGSMIMAIGSGNYFLAKAGLVGGCTVTSHWACHGQMVRSFPDVKWKNSERIILNQDQPLILSIGGGAAWYDGVRHLIGHFSTVANATNAAKAYSVFKPSQEQSLYKEFFAPLNHGDDIILDVQGWIHTHYASSKLITTIELEFPLSPRTLKRRFYRATGFTLIAYVQEVRLKQAKEMLEHASLSIEDISIAVGYKEQNYFRRMFKLHLGMTPAEYREFYIT